MNNNKIILKKIIKMVLIILLSITLILLSAFYLYRYIHGVDNKLKLRLNDDKKITLEYGMKYKEKGAKAYYDKKSLTKRITTSGKVNEKKLGKYSIIYKIKYKKIYKVKKRIIEIVDKTNPSITLKDGDISIYLGDEYNELGYSATDNYDGDITNKVEITNNIDKNNLGEYEVIYKVVDSSGNFFETKRKVKVISKPVVSNGSGQKIAVLNYHFFYDPDKGEECNEHICERVSDFKSHLNYLRDNGYKTLTMKEFRDWMYGEIELPQKSVLITVDDGAMGTGRHNGNKLIPILEEYKMHATLFLITGWWNIDNYRSPYLDIESHTNDMHKSIDCGGKSRPQILCYSNEQILNDLKTSISITNSTLAFCFPFYAYSDNSINLVRDAGFQLAFIGGNRKASRSDDKFHIPRYPIHKDMPLETIIKYVS